MNSLLSERLKSKANDKTADFTAKLVPTVPREKILGLKSADVDRIAGDAIKEGADEEFLRQPHDYLEEFSLHAAILCKRKYESKEAFCRDIEAFLPAIDNWAVCDTLAMGAKRIKKDPAFFYEKCKEWLRSDRTYTVRFAVVVLLDYYLDETLPEEIADTLADIRSDAFYIKMALAWYWSFALIKQYDKTIPYFENGRIKDVWVHNKGIQKARESFRVSPERKEYLASLKIKNKKS